MATIAGSVLTLADVALRSDKDGIVPDIVEILSQTNPMLDDMHFEEANEQTGHTSTIRTGLPAVYWRMINQGLPPSKSTTAQARDAIGMLEAWSETDAKLVQLSGNGQRLRATEGFAFLEAMTQEMQQTVIYGNGLTSPQEFTGLAPRFSDIGSGSPENSQNILDAGGTGSDNTSIYLVVWGPNTVFGIYPQGSKAGIQHFDYGEVTQETTAGVAGNRMRVFQERWTWDCGLVVRDWRYVVRIANIDVSNLVAKSSAADIPELMQLALDRVPNINLGRAVFYGSRTLVSRASLQVQADVSSGGGITWENVDGRPMRMFQGVPVRIVDQILDTEARVV
jgi:hypothetical protein